MTVGAKPRLWIFRRVVRIYFRELEELGDVPDGVTGRLFVANHFNAIVDPILVLTSAPCAISPVAKSTLWKVPGLRWLLDHVTPCRSCAARMIPPRRPARTTRSSTKSPPGSGARQHPHLPRRHEPQRAAPRSS